MSSVTPPRYPSSLFISAAVEVTVVPFIASVSISAVPSMYRFLHCCEELPKSYASSVFGIISELTSAPNTTLSVSAFPNVRLPLIVVSP